jgi:hypothetical protein
VALIKDDEFARSGNTPAGACAAALRPAGKMFALQFKIAILVGETRVFDLK